MTYTVPGPVPGVPGIPDKDLQLAAEFAEAVKGRMWPRAHRRYRQAMEDGLDGEYFAELIVLAINGPTRDPRR